MGTLVEGHHDPGVFDVYLAGNIEQAIEQDPGGGMVVVLGQMLCEQTIQRARHQGNSTLSHCLVYLMGPTAPSSPRVSRRGG